MKKGKSALAKNRKLWVLAAVVLLAAAAFIIGFQIWKQGKESEEKIQRGMAYLESLEKQDVDAISKKIDTLKAEQGLKLAAEDENAVWSGFDSAMILGDSRAVGFRYFELLLEEQVIAESGKKITDVPEMIDKVKKVSPKQVFLCFGLNDIRSGAWPEPTAYAEAYREVVAFLNKELPGTTIYINSVLPAVGAGLAEYADYARIGEYNAALQKMAEKNGYKYIDNTMVAGEHTDLYEADGLHLQKEFYKYWAANMLKEVRGQ